MLMDSRVKFSSSTKHFFRVATFKCIKLKLCDDIIYTLDGWSSCAATLNRVRVDVFSLAAATVKISTFKAVTFQINLGTSGIPGT